MNKMTLLAAAVLAFSAPAWAQTTAAADGPDKSVAVERVPAFPAFERWVGVVLVAPPDAPPSGLRTVSLAQPGAAQADTYQPTPVIVGMPELPLVGPGVSRGGRDWGSGFNYMGMQVRQLVLDAAGRRVESRPLSRGIRAGERFKLRVTASFDAVAEIEQVTGDVWYGQRTGQLYPQAGMSVEIRAGQTVDLPIGPNEFFVMDGSGNERLLLDVRHPKALREARSQQPAYRQDGAAASNYLQLVPRGRFPAFEQLIVQAR